MPKRILIDAVYPEETRVVIHDNNRVQEFDYETAVKKQLKGNIYLAKVTRVEPSLQAAFVDYGGNRHGFLPFSEIHPDYYQIPVSDREKLIEWQLQDATKAIEIIGASDGDMADAVPESGENDNVVEVLSGDDSESSDTETSGASVVDAEDENTDSEVDEILGDEPFDTSHAKVTEFYKNYKINEVIKRNQIILVQVIKEERGNKGASLTTYISMAGRYCVLMPNTPSAGGVSRKVTNQEDRKRLKEALESLTPPAGTSVIVRTAGSGKNKTEIKRDYDYLVKLWNNIREATLSATAPAFIHAEDDLIKRTIRDLYNNKTDEVLVEGEEAYKTAKKFMKMLMPSHVANVKEYKGDVPIFMRYQVEEQLAGLYNQVATLESGGYIVINPTEALIAIDVNSGRATSERNVEETALKTNVEAAREVARQLRLRDLSGLVVIDFIDMLEGRNRRAVEKELRDALHADRAKIQIGRISPFGLLEMSRQRLRPSFLEANTVKCPHCEGRGVVRAKESTAVTILRALASEAYRGVSEVIHIYASADVVHYILNFKRVDITELEKRCNVLVQFHADAEVGADSFSLEKQKYRHGGTKVEAATSSIDGALEYAPLEESDESDNASSETGEEGGKPHWKKQKRMKKRYESSEPKNQEESGKPQQRRNRNRNSSSNNNNSKGATSGGRTRRSNNRPRQGGGQQGEKVAAEGGRAGNKESAAGGYAGNSQPGPDVPKSLLKGIWNKITK